MEFILNQNTVCKLSLPDCLNIPVPYLLQEYNFETLQELRDDDGWSFMHWAIARADYGKIGELKECGFKFDALSKNNNISDKYLSILTNAQKEAVSFHFNIPFNKQGYSPLHLLIFLNKQFEELSQRASKGNFFWNSLCQQQILIFNDFFSLEHLSVVDSDGLTPTDYCFLLENFSFLNHIYQFDPSFNTLGKVKLKTAKHILDIFLKHKVKKDIVYSKAIQDFIDILEIKINKEQLESSLSQKNMIKSKNVKI